MKAVPAPVKSGVCNGACCVVFPLNVGGKKTSARDKLQAIGDGSDDNAFIGNMIFPLRVVEAQARWALFNPEVPWPAAYSDYEALYGCRHWDGQTRRCREYARRPYMCSNYPYQQPGVCEHCGYAEPNVWWSWEESEGGWRYLGPDPESWQLPEDWGEAYTWDGKTLRRQS